MFGGGIKKGFVYGKTADERPCTTIENPVVMEDLHATMYHALGIAARHGVRRRAAAGLCDQGRQGRADPRFVCVGRSSATMKTTRREFLAHRGRGAGAVADSARHAGQGRHEGAGARAAAPTPTKPSTTGASCRRASSGATRTASSRTRRATSTCTTPCTRRATAPTRWSCSIARASSSVRGAATSGASRTACTSARKAATSSST